MPVQLGSKLPPENEARIEIIPLIDIMFFLLAAFMLVSLSMVNLKSVKVDLPTAAAATPDTKKDLLSLSVDKGGVLFLENQPMGPNELTTRLTLMLAENPDLRVFISGDREAMHGDIVRALDIVRSIGIQKVAFEIRPETDN
ncbi:MAG TPA: biopolymer transporter ExbD [Verrucomicrobiales bacterium]|nr:biopolymer transporter ExbD [Verrucomicrobiales bacterium]